ncbi:MAG: Inner rane protein CreD-like protein [Flavipsychrobacter sp.]|nr:Inner rane protein CreD-like protein [Flavipsychrobacter sp.]
MQTEQIILSFGERNKVLIKGLAVGALTLIILIPTVFVANLIQERENRQTEVINEVCSKWAEGQTITGPLLMLPYKDYVKTTDGKVTETIKTAYVLPDELYINGDMQAKEKKRSLYSVALYHSDITISGKFSSLPLAALQVAPESVIWQDARIVMNVADVRGIEDQVHMSWNNSKQNLDAGVPDNKLMDEGLSAVVAIDQQGVNSFSIQLNLRGSKQLYFTPVGKITEVDIKANWKYPAYDGQYLPATSETTDNSFKAHWKILPLSHTYPQFWKDNAQDIKKAAFGVKLIQPVDGYAKTNRSVKYAILFIALTFTFFFFLEILQKRQVHPLQYILVGIALTIFYALLLSISEYTGFNIAYLIASIATVSLIGLYAWSMFKSAKTAAGFTCTLSALYTYIFILIQSEDYALLFGSIGLFVIIAIIMYYSRRIDWYGVSRNTPAQLPGSNAGGPALSE